MRKRTSQQPLTFSKAVKFECVHYFEEKKEYQQRIIQSYTPTVVKQKKALHFWKKRNNDREEKDILFPHVKGRRHITNIFPRLLPIPLHVTSKKKLQMLDKRNCRDYKSRHTTSYFLYVHFAKLNNVIVAVLYNRSVYSSHFTSFQVHSSHYTYRPPRLAAPPWWHHHPLHPLGGRSSSKNPEQRRKL